MSNLFKTILAIVSITCLNAFSVFGQSIQLSFSPSPILVEQGDNVCFHLEADWYDSFSLLQFSVPFDSDFLVFSGIENVQLPNFSSSHYNVVDDEALVVYYDAIIGGSPSFMIPEDGHLFDVCFDVIGEDASTYLQVQNNPLPISIYDGELSLAVTTVAAEVLINESEDTTVDDGSETDCEFDGIGLFVGKECTLTGDDVCVGVFGHSFDQLTSLQFSLLYNPNDLNFDYVEYEGISNFGFPFSTNQYPGSVSFSWVANDVVNGLTFSDTIRLFDLCFETIMGNDAYSFITIGSTPTALEAVSLAELSEIRRTDGLIYTSGADCDAGQDNELVLHLNDVCASAGDNVCLDLSADLFEDITELEFSFDFNPSILSFTGIEEALLPDLSAANFEYNGLGLIDFVWSDQDTTSGVYIPKDSVLYSVCFDVLTENETEVGFAQLGLEAKVKRGDWSTVSLIPDAGIILEQEECDGGSDEFHIGLEHVCAEEGSVLCIDVYSEGTANLISFQQKLLIDPEILEFAGFNYGEIGPVVNVGNMGNQLNFIWFSPDSTNGTFVTDETILYNLCFNVLSEQYTTLSIGDGLFWEPFTAANPDLEPTYLTGSFNGEGCFGENIGNILYQNHPNPFNGSTNIPFHLEKEGELKFSILDSDGKIVYEERMSFPSGYNEIVTGDINSDGILYYRIETDEFTDTKKMIIIE